MERGTAALTITNDGNAPEKPIREGGGLTSLRHRVEQMQGKMELESRPYFALTITIPVQEETT